MERSARQIALELLVLRCQDGERSAWRALFDQWHPRFLAHAQRQLGRPEGADDAVQQAWIAITRSIGRLDDPAAFRAWAYRIVSHKCVDATRKQVRERRLVRDVANRRPATIDLVMESPDADEPLLRAIRTLPPELHAVVALHYGEGMSVAEVAHALDIPPGTVKSRLFTARSRLAEALDPSFSKGTAS